LYVPWDGYFLGNAVLEQNLQRKATPREVTLDGATITFFFFARFFFLKPFGVCMSEVRET
jgi:hypothetical protein